MIDALILTGVSTYTVVALCHAAAMWNMRENFFIALRCALVTEIPKCRSRAVSALVVIFCRRMTHHPRVDYRLACSRCALPAYKPASDPSYHSIVRIFSEDEESREYRNQAQMRVLCHVLFEAVVGAKASSTLTYYSLLK